MRNEELGMKKFQMPLYFLAAVFFALAAFPGCSSAPKKPAEIFTDRIMAANQLNLANQTMTQGRYEDALLILEEARRLAVSCDDPQLRIRTSISRGNILFALGRETEAFGEWGSAAAEGDSAGEGVLAALARIYSIRAELVLLSSGAGTAVQTAEELKTRLSREMAIVKSDPLAAAAGYVSLGLAEKHLGRWAEAESALRNAIGIHDKNSCLEDAAYDWYLIASVRSVAGNYNSALDALWAAVVFDRRAENGFGLASSWQAMGEVYQKAGRIQESGNAYRRAAEIYRAVGLVEKAENLEKSTGE